MSTIQVANVQLESTGNNRIHLPSTNTLAVVTAGANVFVSNSTVTNVVAGGATILSGNSTAVLTLANVATNLTVTGNLVVSGTANLSGNVTSSGNINAAAAYISTNTLNLGTFTNATNGYVYLPNGLKMQWFNAAVTNAAAQALAFPQAFGTNAYGISATCGPTQTGTAAQTIKVSIANGTHVTANSVGVNTSWYFVAVGL